MRKDLFIIVHKSWCFIGLAIDIQSSLELAPIQGVGLVSNTFIFRDENVERIGIYSQRVLKPNPHLESSASGTNNKSMSRYQLPALYFMN